MSTPPVRRPLLALVAVLTLGVAGCADTTELQAEVDRLRADQVDQDRAEAELRDRLDELESELRVLAEPPAEEVEEDDPLLALEASLDTLEDRVTALDDTAATTDEATAAARQAADAAASDLRTSLDEVRDAGDTLRGQVEELRTLYETLRDRLDRLQAR